jgi:hypothetical protein
VKVMYPFSFSTPNCATSLGVASVPGGGKSTASFFDFFPSLPVCMMRPKRAMCFLKIAAPFVVSLFVLNTNTPSSTYKMWSILKVVPFAFQACPCRRPRCGVEHPRWLDRVSQPGGCWFQLTITDLMIRFAVLTALLVLFVANHAKALQEKCLLPSEEPCSQECRSFCEIPPPSH